jgi:hypothetical protein
VEKVMETRLNPVAQIQFPIRELEQIESAIRTSMQWLTILEDRHSVLIKELDALTRPQSLSPKSQVRTTHNPGYEYRGTSTVRWTAIDIYLDVLRRLWTDFPGRREVMAAAVGARGSKRTYIAKSPSELFPQRSVKWALRYSQPLVDGWYVDTNHGLERMRVILPAAVTAAGLKWGTDVTTYWHATQGCNLTN